MSTPGPDDPTVPIPAEQPGEPMQTVPIPQARGTSPAEGAGVPPTQVTPVQPDQPASAPPAQAPAAEAGPPDSYGLPEPPDRGSQGAYGAPPAAPPEGESMHRFNYAVPAPYGATPEPYGAPPGNWQRPPAGQEVPYPYVGGQPAPTPFPAPTPSPAVGSAQPDAYRPPIPPSGGYATPTGAYGYAYAVADPYAKSRTVAGILGILLGGLGIHRFYLGYVGIGLAQIAVTVFTFGLGAIWGFVEGILYLTQREGQYAVDSTGRPLRD